MVSPSIEYIERKIRRYEREIQEIDDAFYGSQKDGDRFLHLGMLERKREDVIRAAVLQMHTSIEDLLNSTVTCILLDTRPEGKAKAFRTTRGQAVRRMLWDRESFGFDMKLNLAVAVGAVSPRERDLLMELNTLRNKCSHNWLLKSVVRRKRRPAQKKLPLLKYQGGDLHELTTFEAFMSIYGKLYAKLFARYIE